MKVARQRTGSANLVTAAGFLVALFCTPLVRMIGGGVPIDRPAAPQLLPGRAREASAVAYALAILIVLRYALL